MTDIIAQAKAALEGITRGPWRVGKRKWPGVVLTPHGCLWNPSRGETNHPPDAQFIVAARTLVPDLVALAESQAAEIARVRAAAEKMGDVFHGILAVVLDAADSHDLIAENGDGDWAGVYERLAELRPARDEARSEVERLRATVERVRSLAENPETYSGTQVVTVKPHRILKALEDEL